MVKLFHLGLDSNCSLGSFEKIKIKMKQRSLQAATSNRGEDTIRKEAAGGSGAGPWVPGGCMGHVSGQGH